MRLGQQEPVLVQCRWARGDLCCARYGERVDQVMGLLESGVVRVADPKSPLAQLPGASRCLKARYPPSATAI